jgi:Uma2 family endonuclease
MELLEKIHISEEDKKMLASGELVTIPATYNEFLDFLSETEYNKVEYINGHLIIMGVASFLHELIVGTLSRILGNVYQDKPDFYVLGSSLGIVIPEQTNFHQADVTVVSGKPTFRDNAQTQLENPYIVVEVLSASTGRYDFTTKLHNYKKIPSVKQIILINQYEALIYSYVRSDDGTVWLNVDYDKMEDAIVIDSYTVQMKEIYKNVL